MTVNLVPLPEQLTLLQANPEAVGNQLITVIEQAIRRQPRTLQVAIGPSEIGHPCARRLGYKLLGQPENPFTPAWKPTIGTAVHAYMEDVFDQANLEFAENTGTGLERWYVETKVTVGEVNGQPITGTADLYDRATGSNWDWKIVGPTQLKKYRIAGPGDQYRAQAHLYGRGWQLVGLPIKHVGIVFLPRNGELADRHIWTEPYDEQIALDALQRLAGIQLAVNALGPQAVEHLGTADAYCTFCPYFRAHSSNLAEGCPGDPAAASQQAASNQHQLDGLIPA